MPFPAPVSGVAVETDAVEGPFVEEALFTVGAVMLPELADEAIATLAAWVAMSLAAARALLCRLGLLLLVGPFCEEELAWLLRCDVGGASPLV